MVNEIATRLVLPISSNLTESKALEQGAEGADIL